MENRNLLSAITPFLLPLVIISVAVLIRVIPHAPNFAPIAALALFSGFYLDKRYALILPLGAMFLSDVIIGFHDTMPYVYGSFLLTAFLGMALKKHTRVSTVLLASLTSSLLFFLLTNFGVWMGGLLYPKTVSGLMDAYYYALPFFRNTVLSDLMYTALFFGGYEIVRAFFIPRATALKKE